MPEFRIHTGRRQIANGADRRNANRHRTSARKSFQRLLIISVARPAKRLYGGDALLLCQTRCIQQGVNLRRVRGVTEVVDQFQGVGLR